MRISPSTHDAHTPRRVLALASVTIALLVPALEATAAALEPGKADGSLTVQGETVQLTHAYGANEKNAFDEAKQDIVVLLTDRAIPEDLLAGQSLDAARRAAKVENYIELTLSENPADAEIFGGFAKRWVIGHSAITHTVLAGRSIQSSPDFSTKVEGETVDAASVQATIFTEGSVESFDKTYEFRVAFHARIR